MCTVFHTLNRFTPNPRQDLASTDADAVFSAPRNWSSFRLVLMVRAELAVRAAEEVGLMLVMRFGTSTVTIGTFLTVGLLTTGCLGTSDAADARETPDVVGRAVLITDVAADTGVAFTTTVRGPVVFATTFLGTRLCPASGTTRAVGLDRTIREVTCVVDGIAIVGFAGIMTLDFGAAPILTSSGLLKRPVVDGSLG
jgi:hypothetical protein